MRKHKYLLILLMVVALLGTGLVFKYSNLPAEDESKYILSKDIISPLNARGSGNLANFKKYGDKVNRVLNEMRASGLPIYSDEIVASFDDGLVDGTKDFNACLEMIKTAGKDSAIYKLRDLWKKKSKLSKDDLVIISELLEDSNVNELIGLADKASESDYLNFGLDYSKGPGLVLPHLGHTRSLMKILSLKSFVDGYEGRSEEAVKNLNVALKLNTMPNDDVTMIGELVENAVSKILNENIMELRSSGADLSETSKLLEEEMSVARESQLKSIDGERHFFGSWIFDKMINSPEDFQSGDLSSLLGEDFSNLSPDKAKDHYAAYLKTMLEVRVLMEEPYYINSEKMAKVEKDAQNSAFLKELLPAYTNIYKKFHESQSLLKKNLLVMKVDEYEKKHGMKPETLNELDVPRDYLIDNVSGKPYQIIRDGEGNLSIAHVGEAGKGLKL